MGKKLLLFLILIFSLIFFQVLSRDAFAEDVLSESLLPAIPIITAPQDGATTPNYNCTVKAVISDNTTTVLLLRDGNPLQELVVGGIAEVLFANVPIHGGENFLQVLARNEAGETSSPTVRIVVIEPVGPVNLSSPQFSQVINSQTIAISGTTGVNTTEVELLVNGSSIASQAVGANSGFSFQNVNINYGQNSITIIAKNQFYSSSSTVMVYRLDIDLSHKTLILIDKSDFRLYYIVDGFLDRSYPIAIGRNRTPTPVGLWIVGEKLYHNPNSIFGPRRLRLYRWGYLGNRIRRHRLRRYRLRRVTLSTRGRRSRRWRARQRARIGYLGYIRTGYGIHGTNQPWVIGTKASHGCIRLYNQDILDLFDRVPLGTKVITRE